MRSLLYRVGRQAHLWLGVCVLLPFLLVSVSGVLLLAGDGLLRVRLPELYGSSPGGAGLGWVESLRCIERLGADTGWNMARLPRPGRPFFEVFLMSDERAYLDPRVCRFADRFLPARRPETLLTEIHARLLMRGDRGERAVGWLGVSGLLMMLTGLCVWLLSPRGLRRTMRFGWAGRRSTLLRSHASYGAALSVPVLVYVLSGTMLVFEEAAARVLEGLFPRSSSPAVAASAELPAGAPPDFAAVLATAHGVFDDDQPTMLFRPAPGTGGPVWLRTRRAGEWHPNGRSAIYVDGRDGRLLAVHDATRGGYADLAQSTLFPIHAAQGRARASLPLALVGGIACVALAWTALVALFRRLGR